MNQSRTLRVMGIFDSPADREVRRIKYTPEAQGIASDAYETHIPLFRAEHIRLKITSSDRSEDVGVLGLQANGSAGQPVFT